MSLRTLTRKPLFLLYVGGALLLFLGGALYWTKVSTSPERVFWKMIEQNLATRSVTISAAQPGQGVEGTRQTIQYYLGSPNLVHSYTAISQAETEVNNEMLATPTADYTRYTHIKTSQKTPDGKPLDFSKVVGVWAKTKPAQNQLFAQAALGTALPIGGLAVPVGYLENDERTAFFDQIKSDVTYKTDFRKAKKEKRQGRQVYIYDVKIQPVAYAALIKRFAGDVGLHQLDQLDPKAYQGRPAIDMQFTVDVRSQRLVEVAIPKVGYSQTYASYDVLQHVELPSKTISTEELQKRLSEL
jgi:hypothetical protein